MHATVNKANRREYGKPILENNGIDGQPRGSRDRPRPMKSSTKTRGTLKRLFLVRCGLALLGDTEFAQGERLGCRDLRAGL
jgi:hypothetical protein